MKEKKLYRSYKDKVIGGVASGIGEYFNIDPSIVRLLFVITTFFGGAGIILYLIAWIIIPLDPSGPKTEPGEEIRETAEKIASSIKNPQSKEQTEIKTWVGLVIVILGILFLLDSLLDIDAWKVFWPALLIVIGLAIIYKGNGKKEK